jgi:hypothetical protein
MRRGWAIALALVVTLLLVGVGVGAYHAGVNQGIHQAADSSQVVQVVGGYGWHGGFFPFGLFLFPLFLFGLFFLIGGAFRRGAWGGGPGHHHGPWSDEGRARFEQRFDEWHTRQHEQGSGSEGVARQQQGSSSEAVARQQQGSTAPDPGGGSGSATA